MFAQLTYRPKNAGTLDYRFRISTHANPYENVEIQLRGCAFTEDLIWLMVAKGQTGGSQGAVELVDGNHLRLKEVPPGEEVAQTLSLHNATNQAINFELNAESLGLLKEALGLTPTSGTIAAGSSCLLNLSFKSEEPVCVTHHAVTFSTSLGQQSEANASALKSPQRPKGKVKPKQADSKADGSTSERGDSQSYEDLVLYLSAASGIRRCEFSVPCIHFETTALFKTRVFVFTIVSCGTNWLNIFAQNILNVHFADQ